MAELGSKAQVAHQSSSVVSANEVLIITDVRLYRDGLAHALSKHEGGTLRARAVPPDQALAAVRTHPPDVILLDATLADGLALARAIGDISELKTGAREPKVLVLAVDEPGDDLLRYMEIGVDGYVARDGSLDDLIAAVESAANGEMLCSPRVAATLSRRVAALAARSHSAPPPLDQTLTLREREVLAQLDRGLSNKQIAAALSIEVATVKNHIHNILDKLHVQRRGEAAARFRADQSGIPSLGSAHPARRPTSPSSV